MDLKRALFILFFILLTIYVCGQDRYNYDSLAVCHMKTCMKISKIKYLKLISENWKMDSLGLLGYRERLSFSFKKLEQHKIRKIRYDEILKYLGKPSYVEFFYKHDKQYLKVIYVTIRFYDQKNLEFNNKKEYLPNVELIFRKNKLIKVTNNHI